jgi:hypothetical protein
VLLKEPRGRDVGRHDRFTVNAAFADPLFRIKINQIQLKETHEENRATHAAVVRDRQYETQAAIVRVMKSRKVITAPELVAETINLTKARGALEPAEITQQIEKYALHFPSFPSQEIVVLYCFVFPLVLFPFSSSLPSLLCFPTIYALSFSSSWTSTNAHTLYRLIEKEFIEQLEDGVRVIYKYQA